MNCEQPTSFVEIEISVTSASVFARSGDGALPGDTPARVNASATRIRG